MSESHSREFKGNWSPAKLHRMLECGEIRSSEFVLLMIIDAHTRRGVGCESSNDDLARSIGGFSAGQISNMITGLKKKNLLIQVGFDGRKRRLRVFWDPELTITGSSTDWKQTTAQTGVCLQDDPPAPYPPRRGDTPIPPKDIVEGRTDPSTERKNHFVKGGGLAISSQKGQPSKYDRTPPKSKNEPKWAVRSAGLLAATISKLHGVNRRSDINSWAAQFRLLHSKDGVEKERVKKVLRWYCDLLDQTGEQPQFVPTVESGGAFRQKFVRLQGAMKRYQKEQGDSQETTGKVVRVNTGKKIDLEDLEE